MDDPRLGPAVRGGGSVLNSTSPIFVFVFTAVVTRHEGLGGRKMIGTCLGLAGVVLIVGPDALRGLGGQVAGQIACLLGAALYACAAIYGRRFGPRSPVATAAGTMIWATIVLVPIALVSERPWDLRPSAAAIGARRPRRSAPPWPSRSPVPAWRS